MDKKNNTIPILKIEPDFSDLSPPIKDDEQKVLEKSILEYGCREPILVWNGSVLDGHKRYIICRQHKIFFTIDEIHSKSKEHAISWIRTERLKEPGLSEEFRRYLIGKRYNAEKKAGSMNTTGKNQYTTNTVIRRPHEGITATKLGLEYHLSASTINKYAQYTNSLDTLKADFPDVVENILKGNIKISQDNLIELVKKPRNEILAILGRASGHNSEKRTDIHIGEADFHSPSAVSVKDMPKYDPNAYIASLTLTIPSWISNINHAIANTDINAISVTTRRDLIKALENLISVSSIVKKNIGGLK